MVPSATQVGPGPSRIPNLHHVDKMLGDLGMRSLDDLYADVPADVRIGGLKLEPGAEEREVSREIHALLAKNRSFADTPMFLGGGLTPHHIPAAVRHLIFRGEFYTSYTPYQPEFSQGGLQTMFEYQSFVSELTGMPCVNSSMYDSATALGEAALLAFRATGRKEFLVAKNTSWAKRSTLRNYVRGHGVKVTEVAYDAKTGQLDMRDLESNLSKDVAGLYVETPNYFGLYEEQAPRLKSLLEAKDSGLLVVGTRPLALGVMKPPGEWGADVVVGEMTGMGSAPGYGGPLLGLMATTEQHVRRMPGRIVGYTKDTRGNRGFVLTLQTREQHIRREKATSNICTNEALLAMGAIVYFSLLGGDGLARLALDNMERAAKLSESLEKVPGVKRKFPGKGFNEFVLETRQDADEVGRALFARGLHGGSSLRREFPELGNASLWATTEVHAPSDYERLLAAMNAIGAEGSDAPRARAGARFGEVA